MPVKPGQNVGIISKCICKYLLNSLIVYPQFAIRVRNMLRKIANLCDWLTNILREIATLVSCVMGLKSKDKKRTKVQASCMWSFTLRIFFKENLALVCNNNEF